ncbi:MAG: hypothetical protein LBE31_07815 [Deltaproteobacteria bacterium]|jgi:hypothetical protein|nr:hypothetical protein [Deltaproteobacteria bacterium]
MDNKKLNILSKYAQEEPDRNSESVWEDNLPPMLTDKEMDIRAGQPGPPPDRIVQYDQVMHIFDTWDGRIARLFVLIRKFKSQVKRDFLTLKLKDLREHRTPEIYDLMEKHYRIDINSQNFKTPTKEGLMPAYLIGESKLSDKTITDEELLKLWKKASFNDRVLGFWLQWAQGVIKQQLKG